VKINLTPEEISKRYGSLEPEMDGALYDLLSKLFKEIIKINIIIPADFKSSKGEQAIKCSVKASDGHLYPLKNSLLFIHKPVLYIKIKEIHYVEFSRVSDNAAPTNRSFEFTVAKADSQFNFSNIDRQEYKCLRDYFQEKGVKVRNVDAETKQTISFPDEEEEDEEEEHAGDENLGRGKRKRRPAKEEIMIEDDEEDDEDFNEEGSPSESDEEGEDEDEELEEMSDSEKKQMKKELTKQGEQKKRREGKGEKGSKQKKK